MRSGNPVQIIQGGMYGSEAKGSVAAHFAIRDNIDIAVRTGATNAGHTVYHHGQRFVMQQLPVGWVNPSTRLVLGAGSLIDPEILKREIDEIAAGTGEDIRSRLFVDPRAYIHWPQMARKSAESGRHAMIGATGKGCSEAMISRLQLRGISDFSFGKHADKIGLGDITLVDTEKLLNNAWDEGARIQLEGTQGQLLDLYFGPYPYTTHKQTGPGQWMSECGLSPAIPTEIVMVIRTFPIRVAGNSGPMPREIDWPNLARQINERRHGFGLPAIVSESAIAAFEDSVRREAYNFDTPTREDAAVLQHRWSADERVKFKEALSWLNARALAALDDATRAELGKLFEMTTVTKKLRRIAQLDLPTLAVSARQMRPSQVVITFLNYMFPEKWATRHPVSVAERALLIEPVQEACNAPVTLINRGPLPENFVEVER